MGPQNDREIVKVSVLTGPQNDRGSQRVPIDPQNEIGQNSSQIVNECMYKQLKTWTITALPWQSVLYMCVYVVNVWTAKQWSAASCQEIAYFCHSCNNNNNSLFYLHRIAQLVILTSLHYGPVVNIFTDGHNIQNTSIACVILVLSRKKYIYICTCNSIHKSNTHTCRQEKVILTLKLVKITILYELE